MPPWDQLCGLILMGPGGPEERPTPCHEKNRIPDGFQPSQKALLAPPAASPQPGPANGMKDALTKRSF
ncbi:hypothetical protein PAPYR_12809 [Paratrimastix pyriformis]|uniref:Uncharacterized protein n=1 Tax=Paratrimastix pyriformis TaxID=342808 RepID=A0ABQ8U1A7_9EUKA|nr:hypothetical protein PAPYR_12809 [Paratrimastix pyriformis]